MTDVWSDRAAAYRDHGGARGQRQRLAGEAHGGGAREDEDVAVQRPAQRGVHGGRILGRPQGEAGDADGDAAKLANASCEGTGGACGTGDDNSNVT